MAAGSAAASPTVVATVAAASAPPLPVSAINSTSGSADAAAGQAQTTTRNSQLAAGTAGGGTGPLTVTNIHTSNVTDTSSASAQSGISVALAPTVLPGTPAPPGITTASSGNVSATGLLAQNSVSNTSAGIVQVGGANNSSVRLTSASSADMRDTAASGAASGQAWAVAPGAAGSPAGVAMPVAEAGGAAITGTVTSLGTTTQNNLSSTVTATLTTAGGPAGARAIALGGSQTANVGVVSLAAAASDAACTGAPCGPGGGAVAAVPAGAPGAQAASGSASAQGLTAQNTVNTTANVAVRVGGQNFSPIQVILDSVTQIFNLGVASATSGDAVAGAGAGAAGGGGAAGQATRSGSAQAAGGQVLNTVSMGSSAAVRVTGDNYNPISIVMDLATNLWNWGAAWARSGDAQATGTGNGAAVSGAVSASGMQVMNLVNMWADASIDIDGNNYAPIFVHITFTTTIDNRGVAQASSGNVAAGSPGTTGGSPQVRAAQTTTGSGQTTASGSVGSSSTARSGNAVAVSNSVVANITSNQLSSANGSKSIAAATIAQMAQNLSEATWNPFVKQNLPADSAPAPQSGLSSSSGDTGASGLQSQIDITNNQLVACKDPKVVCVARNLAGLSVVSQDGPSNPAIQDANGNPGPGDVSAVSGGSFANVTPTPTPTARSKSGASTAGQSSSSSSSASSRRSRSARSSGSSTFTAELPANGHMVKVDLWDQWPGRRLPPMPNALSNKPTITHVTASLDGWPGEAELPLPDLTAGTAPPPIAARGLSRRPAASLQDGSADDTDAFPVLELAAVDPWGPGPNLEALPMPGQVVPAFASAPLDNTIASVAPVEPDDSGATPMQVGLAGLLAAVGALAGLRRGRLMSVLRRVRWLRLPTWPDVSGVSVPWPRWSVVLSRQTQRALAVIRLTLGILRLW